MNSSVTDVSLEATTSKIATGSPLPHLILPLIQIVGLASPPFWGRGFLFVHLIKAAAYLAHINQFSDDPGLRYGLACVWPYYLATIAKFLFTVPEEEFYRLDKGPQKALGWSSAKFKWAAALFINHRGIGWSHQVKGVPQQAPTTRVWFLVQRLSQLLVSYFILDALACYQRLHFGGNEQASLTYRDSDILMSFWNSLVAGMTPYFLMQIQYSLLSIIAVSTGLSAPKDWPPFFGRLRDVITVRFFWGSFWHQMLRRMFSDYTNHALKYLGLRHGTNLSAYTQLYLSFFISASFHALSSFLLPAPADLPTWARWLPTWKFFMLQAVAIHAEDIVIALWKRNLGGQSAQKPAWAKWLGRVWVTVWFWWSLPIGSDIFLQSGMALQPPVPEGPVSRAFLPVGM